MNHRDHRQAWSGSEHNLVLSLAKYVKPEDTTLPYDLFLRSVIDRIVNELSDKLPPQEKS